MIIGKTGDLAYYDRLGELVPVKVIRVWMTDALTLRLLVKVTASGRRYRRGKTFMTSGDYCFPRSAKSERIVIAPYQWELTK